MSELFTEYADPSEHSEVRRVAEKRLASLGLHLVDLKKYGSVLDVGANDCIIEKSAREIGVNSVISVDKSFSSEILNSGLTLLKEDASSLSLSNESVDLALVGSSAYFYTKTSEESLKILFELNRVLKKSGEQRVYPARFGHIIKILFDKDPNFASAKAKSPERRSMKDIDIILSFDEQANNMTLDFLKSHSIPVVRRQGLEPNKVDNFKHYLSIPKF
jgi:ubiquinone/menaquinone biosynthesis C-methylase UbiE